jgi:hypothetical protein
MTVTAKASWDDSLERQQYGSLSHEIESMHK